MDKKVLKKLQQTELDILDEFVRVCDENKINYFFVGGTLLGAVRHHGFIPWDDDIDLGMMRKDYEKFLSIAPSKLKSKFKLRNPKLDKKYYLPFSKIINTKTKIITINSANYDDDYNCIWIDLFPFDCIKKVNWLIKVRNKLIILFSKIISFKTLKLKKKNIIFNFLIFLCRIIPNKLLFKLIFLLQGKNLTKESNVIAFFSAYSDINRNLFKYDDIFPLKKINFEGKEYNVPNNYDAILKTTYGDYMKIPPKEEQITHNPIKIIFEDGETVEFKCNK